MENNFENENIVNELSDEITTEEPKKIDFKKELKEWFVAIVVAVVVAFVIRTYFFELVQVDGPSMEILCCFSLLLCRSSETQRRPNLDFQQLPGPLRINLLSWGAGEGLRGGL